VRGEHAIVAFDFDGTLTRRDTLLPFLARLAGPWALARALARQAPALARAAAGADDARDAAKERLVRTLLAGLDASEVRAAGDAYGRRLARRAVRSAVAERLRAHRDAGDTVVVVSASLDAYLEPACAALGVDAVVCSRLEVDAAGHLTGRLVGGNCRGPAKVVRLVEHPGADAPLAWAYGDSHGDRELLARAEHPVRVPRWPRPARLPALDDRPRPRR